MPVPSFRLSGTVLDSSGVAVVGAQVMVIGTPLPPAVTDTAGHYEFASVPQGNYEVKAPAPGTLLPVVDEGGDDRSRHGARLRARPAGGRLRVRLSTRPRDYLPATTPTGLFGYSGTVTVPLPFEFGLYNGSYSSVNIATSGWVNFLPTSPTFGYGADSQPLDPNATIYPYWNDLFVDISSQVNTDTFGTAPNRVFVVEWRDVWVFGSRLPVSFEVQLGEDGSIVTRYENVEPDPFQRGAVSSIGIEDETGSTGLQFAFGQPILHNDLAVVYTLPPSGFVRGTVKDANDATPVPGASVKALQGTTVVREVHAARRVVRHAHPGRRLHHPGDRLQLQRREAVGQRHAEREPAPRTSA